MNDNQLSLEIDVPIDESKLDDNPMVKQFGYGPQGEKCKNCIHLFYKQFANRYYKCDLRVNTNGTATDQRVNWNACSKFEKQK